MFKLNQLYKRRADKVLVKCLFSGEQIAILQIQNCDPKAEYTSRHYQCKDFYEEYTEPKITKIDLSVYKTPFGYGIGNPIRLTESVVGWIELELKNDNGKITVGSRFIPSGTSKEEEGKKSAACSSDCG